MFHFDDNRFSNPDDEETGHEEAPTAMCDCCGAYCDEGEDGAEFLLVTHDPETGDELAHPREKLLCGDCGAKNARRAFRRALACSHVPAARIVQHTEMHPDGSASHDYDAVGPVALEDLAYTCRRLAVRFSDTPLHYRRDAKGRCIPAWYSR